MATKVKDDAIYNMFIREIVDPVTELADVVRVQTQSSRLFDRNIRKELVGKELSLIEGIDIYTHEDDVPTGEDGDAVEVYVRYARKEPTMLDGKNVETRVHYNEKIALNKYLEQREKSPFEIVDEYFIPTARIYTFLFEDLPERILEMAEQGVKITKRHLKAEGVSWNEDAFRYEMD